MIFIIGLYDFVQHLAVKTRMPRPADTRDQLIDIRPAMLIQTNPDNLRPVPQYF